LHLRSPPSVIMTTFRMCRADRQREKKPNAHGQDAKCAQVPSTACLCLQFSALTAPRCPPATRTRSEEKQKRFCRGGLRDGTIEDGSSSPLHSTSSPPHLTRDKPNAPPERSLDAASDAVSDAPRDFGGKATTMSASKILRRRSEEQEGKRRRAQEDEAKRIRLETRQVLRGRFLLVMRCTSETQNTVEGRLGCVARACRAQGARQLTL